MKTLKEIAEEATQALAHDLNTIAGNGMVNAGAIIRKACLEYAKSILPEKADYAYSNVPEERIGYNDCRSQILTSISEAEKELN